jgi:p-cumate 2,3-dioxygenase beta subunit
MSTVSTRTAAPHAVDSAVTREDVESFLYLEAELLDEWRLDEWQRLLTDDAIYRVPSNDCLDGRPEDSLFIIADDRERIRQRVLRVQNASCHAEWPHSRTQRTITNVRIAKIDGPLLHIAANFVCHRFRRPRRSYQYVGSLRYVLLRTPVGLRIRERHVRLASHELGELGSVSFIL